MSEFILWCYELLLFLDGISIMNEWLMFKNNKIICFISDSKKKEGGKKEKKKRLGTHPLLSIQIIGGKKKWVLLFFLHGFILDIKEKREKKKGARERRKPWILLAGSLNAMFLLCCSLIHSHLRIWEK